MRPQPPLLITCVTRNEPRAAFVRIKLPAVKTNSPEEAIWKELLDGMEAAIRAAAESETATSPAVKRADKDDATE
jgi:hypothetical protein